ncbi:MAG: EAL domain-containing protein [Candidatus Competibacteraceae bacterium]|jgi:diguanylate cyclase (GGDEF)-like protein|nr:EAL domain-containing protein [Candidatus Competibacteraceae bacterium]
MFESRFVQRLILSIVVIQIGVGCALIGYPAWVSYTNHDAQWQRSAKEQSALLATALAPQLITEVAADQLLDTLELLKDDPNLRYAVIFNTQRKLLASLGTPPPSSQDFIADSNIRQTLSDGILTLAQPLVTQGRLVGIVQTGYSSAYWRNFLALAIQKVAIVLAGVLLSIVALLSFSRSARRSLAQVRNGIAELIQEHWEHRLKPDGVLGNLSDEFNRLAILLHKNQRETTSQYEQLLQEWRRLNTLLSGTSAIVWEVDTSNGQFRYVSTHAERLLGYPTAHWLEPDFCQRHVHPNDQDWVQSFLTHPAIATTNTTLDFRIFNNNEECRWLRMIGALAIEHNEQQDKDQLLAGFLLDVTQEKLSEQRITYLANHDPLTGLINRHRFQERLEEQIAYNRRYSTSGVLLFMDLDQFKYINDNYGHHTGDEYLQQIAGHLRKFIRETDVVGRLGGDEFGIILPNTDQEQAIQFTERLLKTLNTQEFIHEDRLATFGASIGIVFFPQHGGQAGELLAKADTAMYTAKDQGRNTYAIFEQGKRSTYLQDKVQWEDRIRRALKDNGFQLYFQPIVDLHSGQIEHYESLLRMIGEDGKIIAPGAFIGIAERFGMIRDIDQWVVDSALQTQGESIRNGKPVSLTINLSGRHFGNPQILAIIQESTQRHGADPNSIVFEVTETAAVENFTDACTFIQALRDKGYRIALDDFGSGFSSFDYLKNIPVDYIKIDGSFVRNLHRSRVDRIFVNAIADLARGLDVAAVAEFVENQETVEILRELGVPLGQGYFFAKPNPQFQNSDQLMIPTRSENSPIDTAITPTTSQRNL